MNQTKVSSIHPEGNINVLVIFHGNPFKRFQEMSLRIPNISFVMMLH